jgi:hypothetical protein
VLVFDLSKLSIVNELLGLEEANGERFLLLATYLTKVADAGQARIHARDTAWKAVMEGVEASSADWRGQYGENFRKAFTETIDPSLDDVQRRGREAFIALSEMATTAREVGRAIDAAELDHRNRVQGMLGHVDEFIQRGWTNVQDWVPDVGPLGAIGESDEDAQRTRDAIDQANRSREVAEATVQAQLTIWNQACEGYASAINAAILAFEEAIPDPPPKPPWWKRWVVDPLVDEVQREADLWISIVKTLFTPESLAAIVEIAVGVGMMYMGAGGTVGGVGLSATGIGAVPGVPLTVASGVMIGGGAVIASKGLIDFYHAMSQADPHAWERKKRRGPRREEVRRPDPLGDDELGGHSTPRHVGKSDKQLSERLGKDKEIPAASTYENLRDARRFSQAVVDEREPAIRKWLKKAKPGSTQEFSADLGEVTGRVWPRTDWQTGRGGPREGRGALVVLKADPSAPGGFYLLTTFPI